MAHWDEPDDPRIRKGNELDVRVFGPRYMWTVNWNSRRMDKVPFFFLSFETGCE